MSANITSPQYLLNKKFAHYLSILLFMFKGLSASLKILISLLEEMKRGQNVAEFVLDFRATFREICGIILKRFIFRIHSATSVQSAMFSCLLIRHFSTIKTDLIKFSLDKLAFGVKLICVCLKFA